MPRVTIYVPDEFIDLCTNDAGARPEVVLEGFVADLTATKGNHGSDERRLAREYYNRVCWDINKMREQMDNANR